jgi:hypothetical protein
LRRAVVELERDRENFRSLNQLFRTAQPPSSGSKAVKIGFLGVLIAIEIFINATFLAKSNEFGLFGGAVQALSFACLNVLVSFFLGFVGARQLNHRLYTHKMVGALSLFTYVSFTLVLNLALAHLREISGTIISDASQQVMQHIMAAPFGLTDLESVIFFAIGVAFSAMSFGDGYLFADPYPGYGQLEQRWKAAQEAYNARKSALIEELKSIREKASETLQEARKDLSVRRSEYDAVLNNRARLVSLFAEHQIQLERAVNALLSKYREVNRAARTTAAPRRFGHVYKLSKHKPEQEVARTSARDDLREKIAENQALLVRQVEAINQEFERAVAGYRQMDDLIPDPTDGAPQVQPA